MKKDTNARIALANKLKMARDLAGLSQTQVAEKMNFQRPTISEIEAGRRNVTTSEIKQFSDIYDVDVNWLLGTEGPSGELVDKVKLAARKLSKLDQDDIDKLIDILKALKKTDGN
jgi:transcriptional regulator with XRE-family HTH domain